MGDKVENNMIKEQFLSPCSSNVDDIFGEPLVLPRVGDQYQAEIPALMMREIVIEYPNYFALGLPVPIMWAPCEVEIIKKEEATGVQANQDGVKKENAFSALPGSLGESWRLMEHDHFVLGLYIFGKNLLLVKRFVKTKEMGDILSYYYGKFYRSKEHRRWFGCRKIRNKRCINGQKIFTGWRQQELLSRLFCHVSEGSQNMLREVSREFGEGKISLEEYVFTLKDTVGIDFLVQAVGIGKGKHDLTRTAMDPIKTNNLISTRPEIPIGKACSSLTTDEILKFLRGDIRLSKARSNDLFWEAVWPRLIARGWHSEQPKGHGFPSSKHSVVFLVPGVKEFSRRRHVKGDHYFDSVTDVLNKVALHPALLDGETEAAKVNEEEYAQDSLSNWQRHCYLQPPLSNCSPDLMKFTVVDTSLMYGEERSKVSELRTLPVETGNVSVLSNHSSETKQDSFEETQDRSEEVNTSNPPELSTIKENGLPSGICENMELQVGLPPVLLCCRSLADDKTNESVQVVVDFNCSVMEPYLKKPESQSLMDLNLPPVLEDLGTDETLITDMVPNYGDSGTNISLDLSEISQQCSKGGANTELQPELSGRRQSTRNRPLTTRALEAIAGGFFSTRRKRKRVDAQTPSDSMSRSSSWVRGRPASTSTLTSNADNDIALGKIEDSIRNSQE